MSKLLPLTAATLLEFPKVSDARGSLYFVEGQKHVPFPLQRVYFINDVPTGASRGTHAHKTLHQVLIVLSGGLTVDLDDGAQVQSFQLCRADHGLYVPPGYWRNMRDFTAGAVCLALASAPYDADDYIRDYNEYLAWRKSGAIAQLAPASQGNP